MNEKDVALLVEQLNNVPSQRARSHKRFFPGRQLARGKIGRNEVCPCGSGKKFKVCCIESFKAVAPRIGS